MGSVRAGSLYGTLEMLILRALELAGPFHDVGVGDHLAARPGGFFQVDEGSLYPALHRLRRKGYVNWDWVKTEEGSTGRCFSRFKRSRRESPPRKASCRRGGRRPHPGRKGGRCWGGDGFPELEFANSGAPNRLWVNTGNGHRTP